MKKTFTFLLLAISLATFSQNATKVIILDTFNKDGRINYSTKMVLKSNLGKAISEIPDFESIVNDEVDAMLFESGFQQHPQLSKDQTQQILKMSGAPYALLSEASIDEQEKLTVTTKFVDLDAYIIIATESTNMSNTPNDILHGCEVLAAKMLIKDQEREVVAKKEAEDLQQQPQQYQQQSYYQQQAQSQYQLDHDIITTKDGKDIQAKILEVTNTEIKYKKYNNPDGPIFTLNKKDVLIVRYQNGENEVFNSNRQTIETTHIPNTDAPITNGMLYKDYKNLYDHHKYIQQVGDPYSPGVSGVASLFIPGLGQCICGEWGRGILYFLSSSVGTGIMLFADNYYQLLLGAACTLTCDIASIVDAVHVAKIKNMYFQDLRGQQASINFGISPYMTNVNVPNATTTTAVGLSFNVSF